MMRKLFLISVFSVLVASFQSCTQDITIDLPEYPPKLVVNCVLMPDTLPRVFVGLSVPVFNYIDTLNKSNIISDATVVLSDGTNTETLKPAFCEEDQNFGYVVQDCYEGTMKIVPGKSYHLSVKYKDLSATADVKIPNQVVIDGATVKKYAVNQDSFAEVKVSFKDVAGELNFYQVRSHFGSYEWDPNTGQFDTVYRYEDGDRLDDNGKDGKTLSGNWNWQYMFNQSSFSADLIVNSTTKATVDYFASFNLQQYSGGGGGNPFVEPTVIKSNIVGGIGVFGAITPSKPRRVKIL